MELVSQIEIAYELGYIEENEYNGFFKMAKNLSVKLTNYVRAIKTKGDKFSYTKNDCSTIV